MAQTYHFYDAVLSMEDFHCVFTNFETDAGFGDVAEVFQDQAVKCLRAIEGEFGPQLAIQTAQQARSFDDYTTIFLAPVHIGSSGGLGGVFSDYLLDQILHGHQTQQLSVLVHHQSQSLLVFLEVLELGQQRRPAGYEIRRPDDGIQLLRVPILAPYQVQDLAHMNDAYDIVRLAPVDRYARVVTGDDLAAQGFRVRIEVHCVDVIARRHHIVDGDLLQLEQVEQDAVVLGRQVAAAFQHQ